jgi:hypothetical protein
MIRVIELPSGAVEVSCLLTIEKRDNAYEREKRAFERTLSSLEQEFQGQYVAIYGGKVVDADRSLPELSKRFFERFGDVDVYMGFVGAENISHSLTPFRK